MIELATATVMIVGEKDRRRQPTTAGLQVPFPIAARGFPHDGGISLPDDLGVSRVRRPYRRVNFSTCPALSTMRRWPVHTGWDAELISTTISLSLSITIFISAVLTVQSKRVLWKTIINKLATVQGEVCMSAHCQVSGRAPGFGDSVSHSHRRTGRRWTPDIQHRTYYLASEGRRIRLRVSTKGMKVIDRDGIEAVVVRLHREGHKI